MNHRDILGFFRSSHRSCSVETCSLKNFENFLGKYLFWSLNLITFRQKFHLRKTPSICFTSEYYNKQQWRVQTRLDFDRVQSKYFFKTYRSSHPEVFCEKGVLRNFTKFIGKQLCQSLFFNKVAGLRRRCFRTPLVAVRNNLIQSNAAKIKKSFFTISINILIIYK